MGRMLTSARQAESPAGKQAQRPANEYQVSMMKTCEVCPLPAKRLGLCLRHALELTLEEEMSDCCGAPILDTWYGVLHLVNCSECGEPQA